MSMQRRLFLGLSFCAIGVAAHAQSPNSISSSADTSLTAQDRLDAATNLYKSLKTYRDDGLLTQELVLPGQQIKSDKPFNTAFERGGRFRWQFRHSASPRAKPDQLFAIWSTDGKSFDSYWTLNQRKQAGQSLDMPLASATGISGGAATAIIPLLQIESSESVWGLSTTDLLKPEDIGQEEVDKVKCWKISGNAKFGDTKVTLWIDNQSLIRKIYNETVVDPSKLPAAAKKAAPNTPAFTSYTTIILNPVINETKIDDTKFTKEEK